MTEHKKDDTALILFILGLFIALAIIILPFVWSMAREEMNKPHTSVIVSDGCKEGASCKICDEKNGTKTCVAGICDAQANCLAPMQTNNTLKYPIRGLKDQVR